MNISDHIYAYIETNSIFKIPTRHRDLELDYVKGVAIVLVVLGHVIQNQSEKFTELMAWRFIYSFHMPLFAFLAGASAAYWLVKINNANNFAAITRETLHRMFISAISLLGPFFLWGLVTFWLDHSQGSLLEYLNTFWVKPSQESLRDYLWRLFKQSDSGLWFLPCIFWCITYISAFTFLTSITRLYLNHSPLKSFQKYLAMPAIQLVILFYIWVWLKPKMPHELGLVFANDFHGGLFLFFLLGLLLFRPFIELKNKGVRFAPYIIFLFLVPYWGWATPAHLVIDAPSILQTPWMLDNYAFIVALSGTLMLIDIARNLNQPELKTANQFMYFLGSASLAVYAIHFYFLSYKPYVVSPILISLLFYILIGYIPVARRLLLGK